MEKKVLSNFKKSQALKQKSYLNFNIKVVLAQNHPLSSDFIYNASIYDYKLFSRSDSFAICNNQTNFHLISKIYDEAGRDIFDANNDEIKAIPDSITKPPINISSFTFRGKLGQFSKNLMTMFSIHSPFNVSFDSLSPLVYFWNTTNVLDNWYKLILSLNLSQAKVPRQYIKKGLSFSSSSIFITKDLIKKVLPIPRSP